MSRSGYSDDFDEYPVELYRQAVHRATTGYRGQHLLKKLLTALDAMPVKRLIADAIQDKKGQVCALGALDPNAPGFEDDYAADALGKHFGIATSLAAEIMYMNDEYLSWRPNTETPEQRWTRMRAWVKSQILPDEPIGGLRGDPDEGIA